MLAKPITIEECDRQISGFLHTLKTVPGQRTICWQHIDYWLDERLELMSQQDRKRKQVPIAD